MNCEEIGDIIAIDADLLSDSDGAVSTHLSSCPNCRIARDEFFALSSQLGMLSRPGLSLRDETQLRQALNAEITGKPTNAGSSSPFLEWTQLRLFPVFVGTASSLAVGFGLLMFMFSDMNSPRSVSRTPQPDRLLMSASDRLRDPDEVAPIYADEYARNRMSVAAESPSLNPQGSLVSMSNSLRRAGNSRDGVVVVANVFSDGLAKIEEVVSPAKSNKALMELQKALDADIGDAPFVPASLDGRGDSIRVVLRFEQVDVITAQKRRNRK